MAGGVRSPIEALLRLVPVGLYHRLRRVPVVGPAWLWLLERALRGRPTITAPVVAGPLAGLWLELDPRVQADALFGRYESGLVAAAAAELRPGDRVFDVGAHLGHVGLLLARAVSPGGQVVFFEPEEAARLGLERNLRRAAAAHSARVDVVAAAVGREPGRAGFSAGTHTTRGHLDDAAGDTVPVTTLDDAARRFGVPRVVKLDIEGAEADALAGGRGLLERGESVFVVEAHGSGNAQACRALLTGAGYEVQETRQPGRAETYLVGRRASAPV